MTPFYNLTNVGMRYGTADVLQSMNLALDAGELVCIAGPNGAGKSTLLMILAGLLPPTTGTCLFLGRAAHHWNRRDFARRVAVVLQTDHSAFPFTAEDIVYMGRMPYRSGLYETPADSAVVAKALEATEMTRFRHREFRTLSSGEKQRILLASALAQSPDVLLLDEPSAHLDLHHQVGLYKLLQDLSRQGLLVVAVTHDLNVASARADRLLLLHQGCMRANGPPADVVRPELVADIFQVHTELHHTSSGQPWISYGE